MYLKLSSLLSPSLALGECKGLIGISKGNLPRDKDWIPLQLIRVKTSSTLLVVFSLLW